jgi:hypothetical protein
MSVHSIPKSVSDVTGQKFGRVTAISFAGTRKRKARWLCRCDCGTVKEFTIANLKNGTSKSCGCHKRDEHHARYKHVSKTQEYKVWAGMMARCYCKGATGYHRYGGRGITVAKEWHDFDRFLADMGERPKGKFDIDRKENSQGYGPGNCRWATRMANARNTRRNHRIEFNGETLTLIEWSEKVGIDQTAIRYRLKAGWPIEKALLTPSKRKHP